MSRLEDVNALSFPNPRDKEYHGARVNLKHHGHEFTGLTNRGKSIKKAFTPRKELV